MKKADIKGEHRLVVRDKAGNMNEAIMEIKCEEVCILPPIAKQKKYPALTLTVIHAVERGKPCGRERIQWKLITDLKVNSLCKAIEKLEWYAMRWKIETFHKILKSGCKAEASKLRSAERLVNVISIYAIVSWRIFWMTMLQRTDPEQSPELALTKTEMDLLDHLVPTRSNTPGSKQNLVFYLNKIARLGGYLARSSDPPPGNTVMWRGMSRLNDIHLGFELRSKNVGN